MRSRSRSEAKAWKMIDQMPKGCGKEQYLLLSTINFIQSLILFQAPGQRAAAGGVPVLRLCNRAPRCCGRVSSRGLSLLTRQSSLHPEDRTEAGEAWERAGGRCLDSARPAAS